MFLASNAACQKRVLPETTPANFTQIRCPEYSNLNFTRFQVKRTQDVIPITFMPRDPDWKEGPLKGMILNYDNFTSPTVIAVHGHRSCMIYPDVLIAALMIYTAGYNVVLLDLRNHGTSPGYSTQTPYITFGSKEHTDVLGALDYLFAKYPANFNATVKPKLGVFGASMGGGTASIAFSKEPLIKAAYIDSGVCDLFAILQYNTAKALNIPFGFVISGACAIGQSKSKYGCPNPEFPESPLKNIKAAYVVFVTLLFDFFWRAISWRAFFQ